MLNNATCFNNIYIVCGRTDLRYGIDSLAGVLRSLGIGNPAAANTLYLFCGRRSDIERVIYKNPTINKDSYPALDNCETELLEMDSLTFDYGVGNLCSVYIREFEDSWFVDVYYFRCHDDNGIDRKHFVIAPGYQMSEEYE